jgi:hypothetical protein
VISYSGTTTDSTPGVTKQIRTLGAFTKLSAATDIRITWNSHVSGTGNFCTFHVRVDGSQSNTVTDNCGAGAGCIGATIGGFSGMPSGVGFPVSTTDVFTGLAAGLHTLTLWDRGASATACVDNVGNFAKQVIVTEY